MNAPPTAKSRPIPNRKIPYDKATAIPKSAPDSGPSPLQEMPKILQAPATAHMRYRHGAWNAAYRNVTPGGISEQSNRSRLVRSKSVSPAIGGVARTKPFPQAVITAGS